jgi:hypothetical protein
MPANRGGGRVFEHKRVLKIGGSWAGELRCGLAGSGEERRDWLSLAELAFVEVVFPSIGDGAPLALVTVELERFELEIGQMDEEFFLVFGRNQLGSIREAGRHAGQPVILLKRNTGHVAAITLRIAGATANSRVQVLVQKAAASAYAQTFTL